MGTVQDDINIPVVLAASALFSHSKIIKAQAAQQKMPGPMKLRHGTTVLKLLRLRC